MHYDVWVLFGSEEALMYEQKTYLILVRFYTFDAVYPVQRKCKEVSPSAMHICDNKSYGEYRRHGLHHFSLQKHKKE